MTKRHLHLFVCNNRGKRFKCSKNQHDIYVLYHVFSYILNSNTHFPPFCSSCIDDVNGRSLGSWLQAIYNMYIYTFMYTDISCTRSKVSDIPDGIKHGMIIVRWNNNVFQRKCVYEGVFLDAGRYWVSVCFSKLTVNIFDM